MEENNDKEYCLEVWGDLACFTRPEFKVERMSYEVITPSAARNIFQAIFWKPAFNWIVTKIEVLNPIKWTNIMRNEVHGRISSRTEHIYIEDNRTQRNSYMLKDVRYRIYARLHFIPVEERKFKDMKRMPGDDETPQKYNSIFERRASTGQCFSQPYLGIREYAAFFRLVDKSKLTLKPIERSADIGIMFYDWDWEHKTADGKPGRIFYHAKMNNGVINVPDINFGKEIIRCQY